MKLNIASIKSNVTLALKSAETYGKAIDDLRKDFKGATHEDTRATLLPLVAHRYGTPLIEGERKAKGTFVLDKEHASYETSRKALGRLVTAILGPKESNRTEPVNPFARAVTQFKTKQQALKAFELAWASKTK